MYNMIGRLLVAGALCVAGAQAAADPASDAVRAARLDTPKTVVRLLAEGLSPNTADPVTGETLLIIALREGSDQVFDVLMLHQDLQLERAAFNGNTALMMAASRRNKRAVELLLARGAVVNQQGWTALHYAAASGDDDIALVLLGRHANIDSEAPGNLTPLMMAAREGHESTARLLLQHGADPTLRNSDTLSAAQIAERADKPRIADAINAHLATHTFPGE